MVIDSDIDDIIYTDAISGMNGNYLISSIEQAGIDPKIYQNLKKLTLIKLINPEQKHGKIFGEPNEVLE